MVDACFEASISIVPTELSNRAHSGSRSARETEMVDAQSTRRGQGVTCNIQQRRGHHLLVDLDGPTTAEAPASSRNESPRNTPAGRSLGTTN